MFSLQDMLLIWNQVEVSVTFVGTIKADASMGTIEKGKEMHAMVEETGMLKGNQVEAFVTFVKYYESCC